MDPEGFIYPIHIVAIRAKDVDLDRKLTILIKNGADIKHKYGSNGLTGTAYSKTIKCFQNISTSSTTLKSSI